MLDKAKELFKDKIDISLYIPLSKKLEIDIMYAIKEKEKLVLIYGDAGNGKTFLMKKVYATLKEQSTNVELYFINNPIEEREKLNKILKTDTETRKIIFVDEAQTLSLEKIDLLRIYSDNYDYTIILATHEREAKELFQKKHFKSRLNYILYVTPCNFDEMVFFISTKLTNHGFEQVERMFRKSNYKLIYKFTKGNLREINRLVYRTFDIIDYFMKKYPSKVSTDKIDNKYIEMANIFIKEAHV